MGRSDMTGEFTEILSMYPIDMKLNVLVYGSGDAFGAGIGKIIHFLV